MTVPECRLEPHDLGRLLQHADGMIAKRGLQRLHVAADRPGALETFRLDVVRVVAVEKFRDVDNVVRRRLLHADWPHRQTASRRTTEEPVNSIINRCVRLLATR